jgi:hypothetical protein
MTEGQSFCAEYSRQSGVDIIGTASEHQIYVAISCPPPWSSYDLASERIPDNLRELAREIDEDYDHFQTRFLLIDNEQLKQTDDTLVLIFRKPLGLSTGYDKQEFHLPHLQAVAPLVREYLMGNPLEVTPVECFTRDILICTHGSRDRCCARFGNPLYYHACQIVADLSLDSVRIWRSSHIGGHRMAATAIDFPEGRYYGYLDVATLTSLLTRAGDIRCFETVYRGWGALPWAAQVLEKHLLLQHGWDWLHFKVTAQVIKQDADECFNQIELICETPTGERQLYHADIVAEVDHTVFLQGSCLSEKVSAVMPYQIQNLTVSSID